jgi:hypothetical protein
VQKPSQQPVLLELHHFLEEVAERQVLQQLVLLERSRFLVGAVGGVAVGVGVFSLVVAEVVVEVSSLVEVVVEEKFFLNLLLLPYLNFHSY